MARTTSRQLHASQHDLRTTLRQLDLFGRDAKDHATRAPAWPELPLEARAELTSLMAQLILEHADRSKTAAMTEAAHDQ